MAEYIAYIYRIYPSCAQALLILKICGCCRKVWNLMLADIKAALDAGEKMPKVRPAQYKKAFPFLKEADSLALCNEQMHLERAFASFFSGEAGFPKFKSRKKDKWSYTTNAVNGNIRISGNRIRLPKLGEVKARIHRTAPDTYKLKSVTVSMDPAGRFYVSVLYECGPAACAKEPVTHIGLDYAADGLYVTSEGASAGMPRWYREAEEKLAREQRKLSRKVKGSRRYEKQRRRVAKLQRHVANQRKDFLHKRSAEITNQYDLVSTEDLSLAAMSRGLRLGKTVHDSGYGMFVHMLSYKQARKGHVFVKVDRFFPSSQLCFACGYQNPVTKDLSVRTVTCPVCGAVYDRDVNAARNIDREGLRLYREAVAAAA